MLLCFACPKNSFTIPSPILKFTFCVYLLICVLVLSNIHVTEQLALLCDFLFIYLFFSGGGGGGGGGGVGA